MMDPYKVLGINPKELTSEILKSKYKKLVLTYHPDVGGSTKVFKIITFCYKYLLEELKTREESKEHNELKSLAKQMPDIASAKSVVLPDAKDFNLAKFNKAFENYKFRDNYVEDGYDDWIKQDKIEDKGAIINYKEPEPLFMGTKNIGNVYEFGKSKVDDYSGDNISNRSLNFMDLKVAYTTSKIVDENKVTKRPEFKDMNAIKAHRANISYTMSPEDLQKHHEALEDAKKKEEERIANMRKQDSKIDTFFRKTNQVMLNMFKS